uniref:Uncharacterized protein n=1 Tax=Pseudomonas putida TaxID=303 RepID=A0A0N9M5Z7_PSEPU|nr:hypothetical protein [Pseudomonas putida]
MNNAKHSPICKVYLHPVTSSRRATVVAFQHRTGLKVVVTPEGVAQAIPSGGAA